MTSTEANRSRKSAVVTVVAVAAIFAVCAVIVLMRRAPLAARSDTAAQPQVENASKPGVHYALNKDDEHVKQVEAKMAPIAARFDAPQGKTPCETAYNGFQAFLEADANGHNTTFALPSREVFLQRCSALKQDEQLCLGAAYQARHREQCQAMYRGLSEKIFDPAPK